MLPVIRLKRICETPGVPSCQATLMSPLLSAAICTASDRPELLERLSGVERNVAPESVERVKRMSRLPGVVSSQATLILAPASTVSHALVEGPELCDRFCALENVAPASPERTKKMSAGLLSSQTTLMLPFLSTAICAFNEPPGLVDTILGDENVAPPSLELLNQMARLPVSLSQRTLMLPVVSTAICGTEYKAVFIVAERFVGAEKVMPPSVERLKKILEVRKLQSGLSSHTILMWAAASTAMTGLKEHPRLLETCFAAGVGRKVAPPSVERLNKILELALVSSSQAI